MAPRSLSRLVQRAGETGVFGSFRKVEDYSWRLSGADLASRDLGHRWNEPNEEVWCTAIIMNRPAERLGPGST